MDDRTSTVPAPPGVVVPSDLTAAEQAFLGELCHQVRTPLNGVLGSLELLMESDLSDDARVLVASAFHSAVALHHLFEVELATVQDRTH